MRQLKFRGVALRFISRKKTDQEFCQFSIFFKTIRTSDSACSKIELNFFLHFEYVEARKLRNFTKNVHV